MTVLQRESAAPPELLMQVQYGPRAFQTMKAAMELRLFEAFKSGARTAADVAEGLKLNVRGTEILLNALVALKFLVKESDDKFQLSEVTRHYLVEDSDLYMGLYLKQSEKLEQGWNQLSETVRTGKPMSHVNQQAEAEEFFPALAEGIFPMSYVVAQMVAHDLADVNKGQVRILDVAAGSGVWSIPLAEANSEAQVDALDFPAVLKVTEKITAKRGIRNQFKCVSGDWRQIEWKDDWYDIMTLGHILHSEGLAESEKLLKRCYQSLKKGGKIVIAEFLSNDRRDGPPAALLFELNMLLHTTDGCVFTLTQLTELMEQCGFKSIVHSAVIGEQPVLIGTK